MASFHKRFFRNVFVISCASVGSLFYSVVAYSTDRCVIPTDEVKEIERPPYDTEFSLENSRLVESMLGIKDEKERASVFIEGIIKLHENGNTIGE